MFGNRFAYEYQGGGDESWTPPWMRAQHDWQQGHEHGHHHGHGPFGHGPFGRGPFVRPNAWDNEWTPPWMQRGPWGARGPMFFAARRGRGPFGGPGGPFGPSGPFGPGGEGRVFGRGDIKYVLLELLQERPMHGYEMIKALEERSGGFYTPSPGSVYPTLQMLEEGGYVTVSEVEGKKVYTITDAGRNLLAERQQGEERWGGPPWMRGRRSEHGGRGMRPELQALRSEAMEVARLFAIAGRKSIQDPQELARLRAIIERTRTDLQAFIYGEGSAAQQPTPSQAGGQTDQPQGPTVEEA